MKMSGERGGGFRVLGGRNIFSGLELEERLSYINTHPSHFHPFLLKHIILIIKQIWLK